MAFLNAFSVEIAFLIIRLLGMLYQNEGWAIPIYIALETYLVMAFVLPTGLSNTSQSDRLLYMCIASKVSLQWGPCFPKGATSPSSVSCRISSNGWFFPVLRNGSI